MAEKPHPSNAVFLSYASEDADAAARICAALRAAGIEVWFDRDELRGGDAWDSKIKKQIHDCTLFVPVISAHSNARTEGYFRREWKLATRRLLDIADDATFLVPVVIDGTREADARVPNEFLDLQWSRLPGGDTPPAFAGRVRQLLGLESVPVPAAKVAPRVATGRSVPLVRRFGVPLVAGLLVLAGGAYWYFKEVRDPAISEPHPATSALDAATTPNEKSIAVLPFADMSAEKNQEYMADGMAEELLNLLAKAPDLKVIARTSSFAFKGQNIEIADIAKKLNVTHVLEGSVRTSGRQMRITAQLIRASDSTHLWSERYDRPMEDVFAVQDEIANDIVAALQIRLKEGTLSRRSGGTQDLEAYKLYLRAESALNQNTKISVDAAESYAKRATELDPASGQAWSTLALSVLTQADNGWRSMEEGYGQARELALHTLELSPDLAEAHATLAYTYFVLDWNWSAAQAEAERAVALNPADPWALQTLGIIHSTLGHWDEAVRQLRTALARDPLNTYTVFNLGNAYYGAGRYSEAEAAYGNLLELAPGFLGARRWLSKTLLALGRPEEALATIQQESDEANRLALLPVMLYAVGRKAEGDDALNALASRWGETWPFYVAQAYAYRGDHDRALEWLERAYELNDVGLAAIVGEPLFNGMADDPRFKAFLRKMKLPEQW